VTRTEADAEADALADVQAQLDASAALQHPDEHPGTVEASAAVLGPPRLRIARDKARQAARTIPPGDDGPRTADIDSSHGLHANSTRTPSHAQADERDPGDDG
jgi:hypothetical protein